MATRKKKAARRTRSGASLDVPVISHETFRMSTRVANRAGFDVYAHLAPRGYGLIGKVQTVSEGKTLAQKMAEDGKIRSRVSIIPAGLENDFGFIPGSWDGAIPSIVSVGKDGKRRVKIRWFQIVGSDL